MTNTNDMNDEEFKNFMNLESKYNSLDHDNVRVLTLVNDAIDFGWDYETIEHYKFVIDTLAYGE